MSSTTQEDENREIVDGINFIDGEGQPDNEPIPDELEEPGSAELAPEEQEGEDRKPPDETEERARMLGWRPKDDWKGDPDKWVSAEAYLAKGEELMPFLKKDREKLFTEVSTLRQQVADVLKYHKEDRERIQKRLLNEYNEKLAVLKLKQRAAVEEGDTEAFDRIEKDKETLEAQKPEEDIPTQLGTTDGQPRPPEFDQSLWSNWLKENPWYQVGPDGQSPQNDITRAAQMLSFRVQAENPHLTGYEPEFLDKVKEAVKVAYPDKFENPRRQDVAGVESADGQGPATRTTKKTYADLPADARQECAIMEKAGMKRSEFVAEYFGQEGTIKLGD